MAKRETIDEAGRCVNTLRPLARSTSTQPKEGLAMKATRTCSLEHCNQKARTRGWCVKHYSRWLRTGSTAKAERTWLTSSGYVQRNAPAHPTARGNGNTYVHRQVLFDLIGDGSHPCNWCGTTVTWFTQQWGTELVVDHVNHLKTDNRPENLVASCNRCNSQRDRDQLPNCRKGHPFGEDPPTRDGHRVCPTCLKERRERELAKRPKNPRPELTHCLRGHEYTPENTYVRKTGRKTCRECRRLRDAGAVS